MCWILSSVPVRLTRKRATTTVHHDSHWHQKLRGDTAPLSLRGKSKTFECFAYKPSAELLRLNKSAVRKYNEEHGSYQHVQ